MSVLVTGGAGYIGSHMVELLVRHGHEVVIIDNLLTGHRKFVPPDVSLYDLDVGAGEPVTALLRAHAVSTIFHFAWRIQVGESVVEPRRYSTDSLAQTIRLLESALDARAARFIYTQFADTYQEANGLLYADRTPQFPLERIAAATHTGAPVGHPDSAEVKTERHEAPH